MKRSVFLRATSGTLLTVLILAKRDWRLGGVDHMEKRRMVDDQAVVENAVWLVAAGCCVEAYQNMCEVEEKVSRSVDLSRE